MIRTQIYITEKERQSLTLLAKQLEKTQSELIREAIDLFCASRLPKNRLVILRSGRGVWEKRSDLPDYKSLRQELDRDLDNQDET